MCNDKTIKELLPAYLDQALDQTENVMIENHLASCEECRAELSLLHLMAEDAVPDPGEAFWAAMPDRVYPSIQKRRPNKKIIDLARLLDWMTLSRWTWAASTVAIVLIISLFIATPLKNTTEILQSQGDEFVYETSVSVTIADLDQDELGTIDSWAGGELASIAQEAEPLLGNGRDTDIYEAVEDLNAREVEQLSKTLAQIRREG